MDCFKCSRYRCFTPRDEWKGMVARKVAYMRRTYPVYEPIIEARVMTRRLMVRWARDYPITQEERRLERIAYENQGNSNPYVISR